MERDIIKKGSQHLLQGSRAIYVGFIKEHRNLFPIERMCQMLTVSISGYYYWLTYPVDLGSGKKRQIPPAVKKVHQQGKDRNGSPRLQQQGIKGLRLS